MIIRIRLNIMKLITHFITFYRIMLRKEYHNYYIYIICNHYKKKIYLEYQNRFTLLLIIQY